MIMALPNPPCSDLIEYEGDTSGPELFSRPASRACDMGCSTFRLLHKVRHYVVVIAQLHQHQVKSP